MNGVSGTAMDDVDHANWLAEQEIERALSHRPRFGGDSATECEECGNPIPEARRRLLPGVRACVECAAAGERRGH